MGTFSQFIDITGQTFNELTALECIDSKNRIWLWQCSCGKTCIARKNDVTSGRKKSCGHLCNRGVTTVNIGDKFGEWTVLQDIGNRHFLCRCSCGVEKSVGSYDLRKGKSKSCGHLTKGTSTNGHIDMTGQKIGEWTVGDYIGDGYYQCTCSCGTVKNLKGNYLRTGQSKSCGCKSNKFNDLTGKVFGEWTALEYLGDYKWLCRCSCGNIKKIASYDLTHGKSTNCGHKRTPDLIGKRFGKLVVTRNLHNRMWECQCDCGNITKSGYYSLKIGERKSCGCLKDDKEANLLDSIINMTSTFINTNNQLPFSEDIAIATGLTPTTVNKYINKYNLTEYFNKHFGSRAERDIYNYCNQFGYKVISRDRKVISPQELDIYIPEKKLAIEFNGNYWHSNDRLQDKFYHQNKTIACAKQGIRLIHIFEYEWNDIDKQNKILKMLNRLLSNNTKTIYGRNTNIEQIYDEDVVKTFLNKYHIQGYSKASINLGCYSSITNELLGIMTFGTPRFNNNYQYELIRFCWKDNITVVGGAEKLFKYFCDTYNPDSVITYSDLSKFTGNVYTHIGFKPIQPKPITEPNYVWLNENTDVLFTRYQTQKQKLINLGLGTENQTETEIMINNGFIQIFDCGNIKLEYFKN